MFNVHSGRARTYSRRSVHLTELIDIVTTDYRLELPMVQAAVMRIDRRPAPLPAVAHRYPSACAARVHEAGPVTSSVHFMLIYDMQGSERTRSSILIDKSRRSRHMQCAKVADNPTAPGDEDSLL